MTFTPEERAGWLKAMQKAVDEGIYIGPCENLPMWRLLDALEQAEAERDVMLEVAERFAPCPFVLYPDSDKRLYKEECKICQPKREKRKACLLEWAKAEALKRREGKA